MSTSGSTDRVFLTASGVESGVPCASPSNEAVSLYKSSVSTSAFLFDNFGTGSLIEGAFRLGAFSVSEYCQGSAPRPKITKNASFFLCISVDSLRNSVKFVLVK